MEQKELESIKESLKRFENCRESLELDIKSFSNHPLLYKKDFIIGKIVDYHKDKLIDLSEIDENLKIKLWNKMEGSTMFGREITFRYFVQVFKSEIDKIRKILSVDKKVEPTEVDRNALGVLEFLDIIDEFKDSEIVKPDFKSKTVNKEIFAKYDKYVDRALKYADDNKKVKKVAIKTHDHSKLCVRALKKILITMINNDQSFNRVLSLDLENLLYATHLHDCVKINKTDEEVDSMNHADKNRVAEVLSYIYEDEINIKTISNYIHTHSSKNSKLYPDMLVEQKIIIDADILSKLFVEGAFLLFKHKKTYNENIQKYKNRRLSKDAYSKMTSNETKCLFEAMRDEFNKLIPDTLDIWR